MQMMARIIGVRVYFHYHLSFAYGDVNFTHINEIEAKYERPA